MHYCRWLPCLEMSSSKRVLLCKFTLSQKLRCPTKKSLGSSCPLQGHTPYDLTSSHQAPPFKGSTTSQQHHGLQLMSLWGHPTFRCNRYYINMYVQSVSVCLYASMTNPLSVLLGTQMWLSSDSFCDRLMSPATPGTNPVHSIGPHSQ
jgi:hypothetical protein